METLPQNELTLIAMHPIASTYDTGSMQLLSTDIQF
jgi:hypothetical protein